MNAPYPHYGITRIDSTDKHGKRTRCWWVRLFYENGRPGRNSVQKSFPDRRHGGRKAALREAMSWRDEQLEKVGDEFQPEWGWIDRDFNDKDPRLQWL